MASVTVDVDLDEFEDEELIAEVKKRCLSLADDPDLDGFTDAELILEAKERGLTPEVFGRDAEYLKECIQKQDWDGSKIYFQRIFPFL